MLLAVAVKIFVTVFVATLVVNVVVAVNVVAVSVASDATVGTVVVGGYVFTPDLGRVEPRCKVPSSLLMLLLAEFIVARIGCCGNPAAAFNEGGNRGYEVKRQVSQRISSKRARVSRALGH